MAQSAAEGDGIDMNANEEPVEQDGVGRAREDGAAVTSGRPAHSNLRRAAGIVLLGGGAALAVVGEVVLIAAVPELVYEGPEAGWHTAWASIFAILGAIVFATGLLLLLAGVRLALEPRAAGGRRGWLPIAGGVVALTLAVGAIVAGSVV